MAKDRHGKSSALFDSLQDATVLLGGIVLPLGGIWFWDGFPTLDLVTVEKVVVSLVWLAIILVIYYNKKLKELRHSTN